MISDWPVYKDEMNFADAEKAVSSFQEVVRGIRNTRNEMNVPQNRKTNIYIVGKDGECCPENKYLLIVKALYFLYFP